MNLLCRCVRVCSLVALLVLPRASLGLSYVMISDADLADRSQGVVVAQVMRSLPVAAGHGETHYLLRLLRVLAGPSLPSHEVLALPGNLDAAQAQIVVPGIARLRAGDTVLLFYLRRGDGMLQANQLSLGVFTSLRTPGGEYYVRHLEGAREYGKDAVRLRFHAPRAAWAFEQWLVDWSRGIRRAPDYLRPELDLGAETLPKFTFGIFDFSPVGESPNDGPGRWFQFDSDQTLLWRAGPEGQAGTATNEFTALQQALGAWTNDATSRILLGYGGTGANPSICNNPQTGSGAFAAHVCWNDATGLIPDSYVCGVGGVLAIGGSSASSLGQTFAGQTWYPRRDGFVIVQDGAGCFMDGNGGADGAAMLTHEIGHALAFGHSCGDSRSPACNTNPVLNQATMRALVHSDGRGAVLGEDDRAAAAAAYPENLCTAPCIFRNGFQ